MSLVVPNIIRGHLPMIEMGMLLAKRKKLVSLKMSRFNHSLKRIMEHMKKTYVTPHFLLVNITTKVPLVPNTRRIPYHGLKRHDIISSHWNKHMRSFWAYEEEIQTYSWERVVGKIVENKDQENKISEHRGGRIKGMWFRITWFLLVSILKSVPIPIDHVGNLNLDFATLETGQGVKHLIARSFKWL